MTISVDARIATALRGLADLFEERDAQSPQPGTAEDRLLAIPEAATMLGVPESHLYEMVRQGRFPSVRIGKKYKRLRFTDVQAAIRKKA
jgi:excisionase family DNA binding protein